LLPQHPQDAAAPRRRPTLLDEAAALVSPTSRAALQASIPMARAEVDRLAGAPSTAEASRRSAAHLSGPAHPTP